MKDIKSIWFDWGNVLLPVEKEYTEKALAELGASKELKNNAIFQSFEKGKVDEEKFIKSLKGYTSAFAYKSSIRKAWNKMLQPFPAEHLRVLKRLKKEYSLVLVSNTNPTHVKSIKQSMGVFQFTQFMRQFEQVYLSYEQGKRKPEVAFFKKMIKESKFKPEECLLVDDMQENLDAAEKLGLQTLYFNLHEDGLKEVLKAKKLL